jgi:hypothetical protein
VVGIETRKPCGLKPNGALRSGRAVLVQEVRGQGKQAWYMESQVQSATAQATAATKDKGGRAVVVLEMSGGGRKAVGAAWAGRGERGKGVGLSGEFKARQARDSTGRSGR